MGGFCKVAYFHRGGSANNEAITRLVVIKELVLFPKMLKPFPCLAKLIILNFVND